MANSAALRNNVDAYNIDGLNSDERSMIQKRYLEVGDVFPVGEGMHLYGCQNGKPVPAGPDFANSPQRSFMRIGGYTENHLGEPLDTMIFAGSYVVIETRYDGSSHQAGYSILSGHHVFAQKLTEEGVFDPKGLVIDFWQSGKFIALHTPETIQPERKMNRHLSFT